MAQTNKRSFDGCITCRNRKVKCGKERPKCLRCAKAKLECRGYGFTLKFKDTMIVDSNGELATISLFNDNSADDRAKRQRLELMHFPSTHYYSTFDEVDQKLNLVEALEIRQTYTGIGPFGKFKVKKCSTVNSQTKETRRQIIQRNMVLPSFSSITSMGIIPDLQKTEKSTFQSLPLVPVLEMNYQRKQLQRNYDNISTSVFNGATIPTIGSSISSTNIDDNIATSLWIHPRLEIDAILTYQALVGTANVVKQQWDVIKKVIFSELYGTAGDLKNRIVDKMNLSLSDTEKETKKFVYEVFRALNDDIHDTMRIASFTSLLRSQRVKNWFACLTYCMVALSLTAFSQYKVLFNEFGIYDESLKLFRCYIAFREMSLVNLGTLITPLLDIELLNSYTYKIKNFELLERIIKVGLLKELVLTLILAIYQDSSLDIICNYALLHHVLRGIQEYCKKIGHIEEQIDEIWEWFRYLDAFYKSCSKIDLENYIIDEEGFEDVKSDYNLIQKFQFDDYFNNTEFNKIEIQAVPSTVDKNSNNSSEDENDADADADADDEETIPLVLPPRLAKRPNIEDKPPRRFNVRFHFSETDCESDDELEDDSLDESNLVKESSTSQEVSDAEKAKSIKDSVAASGTMPLKDREQISNNQGKIKVFHPSSLTYRNSESRPSLIELSFGMPLSLLELMERTVRLTDHKNWCLRKKIFARNFPKFCCDLEEDLLSWKLEWDLYKERSSDAENLQFHSLFHKALYHLAVAFYNTLLMFFYRLIKETDPVLLQNHVSTTVKHLEELRKLSLRSDFLKDLKISPPFWCFMISGSDATTPHLQHRFDEMGRKWFVAGNKWIGKQVMMEVWRNREEAENNELQETISWLDLVKDWEISGFN
ncbi:hypothetical protein CANINC_000288 [Pichia inconspicua]|uniref:Zn(2)-C6 fungal-type domain-containing protein n=1 Tax=Pichia inconspicua TaxID=52247 RepID=A0A4T0X6I7_9ASCO|nr:hypothetical protein CANINC_000288 [[Candida] inconspicua]